MQIVSPASWGENGGGSAESTEFYVLPNKDNAQDQQALEAAKRDLGAARTDVKSKEKALKASHAALKKAQAAQEEAAGKREEAGRAVDDARDALDACRAECHPRLLTEPLSKDLQSDGRGDEERWSLAAAYEEADQLSLLSPPDVPGARNARYEDCMKGQVMSGRKEARNVFGMLCELVKARCAASVSCKYILRACRHRHMPTRVLSLLRRLSVQCPAAWLTLT